MIRVLPAKPGDLVRAYFAAIVVLLLMTLSYCAGLATGVGMAVQMLKRAAG